VSTAAEPIGAIERSDFLEILRLHRFNTPQQNFSLPPDPPPGRRRRRRIRFAIQKLRILKDLGMLRGLSELPLPLFRVKSLKQSLESWRLLGTLQGTM